MSYTWRTDPVTALVRVRDDGGEDFTPTLKGDGAAKVDGGIARFGMGFRLKGETYGVDWRWLIAMAYRESGFNPRAFRQERHADADRTPIISPGGRPLTGCGLFQVTHPSLKGSYSDEQLFDTDLNTIIAARHIGNLMRRDECRVNDAPDFVRVAAAFNAGSVRPSSANKWGFVVTGSHLDAEVAALNYAILRGLEESQRVEANVVAHPFDLRELVGDDGEERPA